MVCLHRRHLRLDNLRTLVLADNNLARIQLSTDDDGASSVSEEEDSDWVRYILMFRVWFMSVL
jgi:hypothetical protein